jgi:hypothetical protein
MNNSSFNVVLQRVGDEAPITLGDEKCLIRTVLGDQRVDCCAIINGPNGTAIRSYRSGVLVNGEPTSVRQLSTGDVIELPCETKIEVQQATQIRPVISQRVRSEDDVDQQLAGIQSRNTEAPDSAKSSYLASPVADKEEKFLSPFSPDLPEITSESFGQPVATTASQENQLTTADALSNEVTTSDHSSLSQDSPLDEQDLESIFAKLGVTNVGSIASPAVEGSAQEEPEAKLTTGNSTVTQATVQQDPASKPQPMLDDAAAIRRQLEGAAIEASKTPQPVPEPIVDLPEVTSSEPAAVPASVPQPVVEVPQPETPVAVAPAPAVPAPALTVAVEPEQNEEDPLSELPADLRDQLNDLVSSLKNGAEQTASLSSGAPVVDTMGLANSDRAAAATPATQVAPVEPSQPVAQAQSVEPLAMPTPAAPAPPVASEPIPVQEVAPQQVAPSPTAVSTPPVAAPAPAVAEVEKNRSVLDVLGAMGMAIPGEDDADQQYASAVEPQSQQPQTAAPTPEAAPVAPASPVFSNIQSNETPADSSSPDNNENAEEDIQAYMNRLLNRSASTTQPEQASPTLPVAGAPVAQTEQPKPREVVQVLSEEEFVPTHKATRPENYDTLREIANTTSRTAIEHSTKNVKKGGLLKVVLAFVLFTFAAAAYLMMSGVLDDSVKENPSEATVQQTVDK